MATPGIAHTGIVSRDQWLIERKKLLAQEKELTKHYDRVNAERRRLPMVKLEKDYVFDGPHGQQSLEDLFDGRRQLIVYHFMFDPAWDKGCSGYRRPRQSLPVERSRHHVGGRLSCPARQA
jgi:predicted dithiol-disulfide oxidoreductase (DUF899 family)